MDNNEQQNGQSIDVKTSPAQPIDPPQDDISDKATTEVDSETNASEDEMVESPTPSSPEAVAEPTISPDSQPSVSGNTVSNAPKSPTPIIAIIAAILVALCLAAVTVYAYLQQQDKDKNEPIEASQSAAEERKPAVTESDFDEASRDVDKSLEATEEADFPDSELTDQSLGL